MFGEKCFKCNERVKKKHNFCPYCGTNLNQSEESEDYGFLGKMDDSDFKLPFGFNMLMKPLVKELTKQMMELDKELKKQPKESNQSNNMNSGKRFTIHIGVPGSQPMKINTGNNNSQVVAKPMHLDLPKISGANLNKAKDFPRKEPTTNVRRLSDRVIYEVEIPGVDSADKVNLSVLEEGLEIKAIGEKVVYIKFIDILLPLKRYELRKDLLIVELGLK